VKSFRFLYAVSAACLLVTAIGVQVASSGTANASKPPIAIGSIFAESGPYAIVGQDSNPGIQVAIDQANATGGIHGQKLVLSTRDDLLTPTGGVASLIADSGSGVKYIIGGELSPICQAMSSRAKTLPVLYVIGLCSDDTLTGPGVPKNVFRVIDDNADLVAAATYELCDGYFKGAKHYDVLGEDYDTGTAQEAYLQYLANQCGITPTNVVNIPLTATDALPYEESLLSEVSPTAASDTVLLFLVTGPISSAITSGTSIGLFSKYKAVLDFEGNDTPLIGEQSQLGSSMPSMYILNNYYVGLTQTVNKKFVAAYTKLTGSAPGDLAALAYEDAEGLITALKKASDVNSIKSVEKAFVGERFVGLPSPITVDTGHNGAAGDILHSLGPSGPGLENANVAPFEYAKYQTPADLAYAKKQGL